MKEAEWNTLLAVVRGEEPARIPVGFIIDSPELARSVEEAFAANVPQTAWQVTLTEAGRLATEVLAPLNRAGDLQGAALENGAAVIADRYFLSSLAYGAVDVEMEWLAQINSRFLAPDLTIYLDVPPEVCAQRIAANGESAELFEKVEILEIVRHNYKEAMEMLKGKMKIVLVDGNQNKEEVFADVINKINL
mgnify:CR=1 FL=1